MACIPKLTFSSESVLSPSIYALKKMPTTSTQSEDIFFNFPIHRFQLQRLSIRRLCDPTLLNKSGRPGSVQEGSRGLPPLLASLDIALLLLRYSFAPIKMCSSVIQTLTAFAFLAISISTRIHRSYWPHRRLLEKNLASITYHSFSQLQGEFLLEPV